MGSNYKTVEFNDSDYKSEKDEKQQRYTRVSLDQRVNWFGNKEKG